MQAPTDMRSLPAATHRIKEARWCGIFKRSQDRNLLAVLSVRPRGRIRVEQLVVNDHLRMDT